MATQEEDGNWCATLPWERYGKAMACEFLGCLMINLFGCGAAIATGGYGYQPPDDYNVTNLTNPDQFVYGDDYHMVVSIAFGLVMTANVSLFLHVSGAHMNPSVTLGMLVIRKVALVRGLLYMPAQFLGSLAGSGLLKLLTPPLNHRTDVFAPYVNTAADVTWWQAALWEFFLTFHTILVFLVIIREIDDTTRSMAPLILGVTAMLNHMAALYASSGCNNPARAIGASIVSLEFEYLWVFVSFSPAGAILGAVLHYLLFLEAHADEPDEAFLPPKKR